MSIEKVKEIALLIIGNEQSDESNLIISVKNDLSIGEIEMAIAFSLSVICADGKIREKEINYIEFLAKELNINNEIFGKLTYPFFAMTAHKIVNKP